MVKFFVATGLAVASATDCGECWELDFGTGKCVPQSDKVTTICGSNTIKMVIDSCILEETHNYEGAFVGSDETDDKCQAVNDDGVLVLEHGLEECGTTMQYDADNGKFIFKNNMNIPSKLLGNTIFTSKPINWSFQCSFDKSYEITADEMSVDSSSLTDNFEGVGQFDLSLSFYTSSLFEDETDSAEQNVGKPINFGVTFNSGFPLSGLTFAPTACEVVNVENSDEVYGLWESINDLMCNSADHPLNFVVHKSPSPTNNQFYGLSYSGFAFNSVSKDVGQQLLKCHIEICDAGMENSVCQADCSEETTVPPTTTPPTTDCSAKTDSNSYPWTMNEDMEYFDTVMEYYYPDNYPDVQLDISAGDTIQLSKMCTDDWYHSGASWIQLELGCDHFSTRRDFTCVHEVLTPEIASYILSKQMYILQKLLPQDDGTYLSILNCPQCGCTPGQNDALTFEQLQCIADQDSETTT